MARALFRKAVAREVAPKRGSRVVYCIDVADHRNFMTTAAVVHNCRGELENDMKTAEVCCAPRLLRELAALPKEVPIVTLGKSAAKSVLGTRSIFMARGFVWTVKPIEVEAVRAARVAYRKSTGRVVKRGPKGGIKELKVKPGSPTTQIKARLKWLVLKWRRRLSGRTCSRQSTRHLTKGRPRQPICSSTCGGRYGRRGARSWF